MIGAMVVYRCARGWLGVHIIGHSEVVHTTASLLPARCKRCTWHTAGGRTVHGAEWRAAALGRTSGPAAIGVTKLAQREVLQYDGSKIRILAEFGVA